MYMYIQIYVHIHIYIVYIYAYIYTYKQHINNKTTYIYICIYNMHTHDPWARVPPTTSISIHRMNVVMAITRNHEMLNSECDVIFPIQ